jgi:hypothetical protein
MMKSAAFGIGYSVFLVRYSLLGLCRRGPAEKDRAATQGCPYGCNGTANSEQGMTSNE